MASSPKRIPAALLLPLLLSLLSFATRPFSAAAAKTDHAQSQSPSPAVTTSIQGRLRLPDPALSLNSTRVTLNDGATHSTYTRPDGSFVLYRVPPGVHLLDVQSREHHFSQVKIQLLAEAMDVPKCVEYVYPGATKRAVPHPLELTAHASYEYYEPRQGFSPFAMLRNPMLLMMLVSVGGMFMMPRMMEGLEPEEKERMQRQMAMQQDPSKVRLDPFDVSESGLILLLLPSTFVPFHLFTCLWIANCQMLTQMFQDMTGTGEEPAPPSIERKPSSKAGGKTARRGKRD